MSLEEMKKIKEIIYHKILDAILQWKDLKKKMEEFFNRASNLSFSNIQEGIRVVDDYLSRVESIRKDLENAHKRLFSYIGTEQNLRVFAQKLKEEENKEPKFPGDKPPWRLLTDFLNEVTQEIEKCRSIEEKLKQQLSSLEMEKRSSV